MTPICGSRAVYRHRSLMRRARLGLPAGTMFKPVITLPCADCRVERP